MNVPAPPRRDPRATRWPLAVVREARLLANGGWTVTEIRHRIERQHGRMPAETTVQAWIKPGVAERRQRQSAISRNRHRIAEDSGKPGPKAARFPSELTDDVLLAMRVDDGLSLNALAAVIARFYGVRLTVGQIRTRLDKLGAPRNENKARRAVGNAGRFGTRAAA